MGRVAGGAAAVRVCASGLRPAAVRAASSTVEVPLILCVAARTFFSKASRAVSLVRVAVVAVARACRCAGYAAAHAVCAACSAVTSAGATPYLVGLPATAVTNCFWKVSKSASLCGMVSGMCVLLRPRRIMGTKGIKGEAGGSGGLPGMGRHSMEGRRLSMEWGGHSMAAGDHSMERGGRCMEGRGHSMERGRRSMATTGFSMEWPHPAMERPLRSMAAKCGAMEGSSGAVAAGEPPRPWRFPVRSSSR